MKKMKITVYEADDGSRWDDEHRALERDALIIRCRAETTRIGLRETPAGPDFGNGDGFVQQPGGARSALFDFLKSEGVSRDTGGPLGKLMYRGYRIDDQDREWGQACFANNPHMGKAVSL